METIHGVDQGLNGLRLDFTELTRAYALEKQQHAQDIAALRAQLEAIETCLIEQTNRLTVLERGGFWARVFRW